MGCSLSDGRLEGDEVVCPCHGSRFDPQNGGAAVLGPATQPLAEVPVVVDTSAGVVRQA